MPMDSSLLPEFRELAAAHLQSAYNLARWLVRDPALADDVVQDAMLRALRYYHGFRGENARAWLLQIVRNVAEKMLIYGLGRGVEYYDRPAVQQIVDTLRASDDRFSALILAVARSFPFQHRRSETP